MTGISTCSGSMTTAEQRRLLITGASSGIGLEAAKILLARGDALTIVCRNAERAERTRMALSNSVETCIADLGNLVSVAKVIEELLPRQMDEAQTRAAIDQVKTDLDATDIKSMGKVMAELKARHGTTLDMTRTSGWVKESLS